jgi:hypothetical protein
LREFALAIQTSVPIQYDIPTLYRKAEGWQAMDYSTDRLYHYWQSYGECDLSCGRRRDALEKLRKALVLAEEFGERDLRLTRTLTALGLAELDSRWRSPRPPRQTPRRRSGSSTGW